MSREQKSCLTYLWKGRTSVGLLTAAFIIAFTAVPSWTHADDSPPSFVTDQECEQRQRRFSEEADALIPDRGTKHFGDHAADMMFDLFFNPDDQCLKRNPWLLHPGKKQEDAIRELIDKQLQEALKKVSQEE
jgi:hypothetical protein